MEVGREGGSRDTPMEEHLPASAGIYKYIYIYMMYTQQHRDIQGIEGHLGELTISGA